MKRKTMNLELWYLRCNLFVSYLVVFLLGGVVYGSLSWWTPFIVAITPTLILLVIVLGALGWSIWLTKDSNVD